MAEKEKECPSCALNVPASAEACPFCQYEFPVQKSSRKVMAWVMALLLAWPLYEVLKLLFR